MNTNFVDPQAKTDEAVDAKTAQLQELLALKRYQVQAISVSKGLEFDNVLVDNVSADNYVTDREQRILYTAFSRAMDRLFITYSGTPSKFLDAIIK